MLLLSKILLVIAAPFMGSFIGAVITRWSSGRPLYSGRATCDCGQVVLAPRDMIPIASWALSRGRCRICARGLGRLYPGIEIAALVIALWSLLALPAENIWTGAAFGWTLMVIVMIVWRQGKLPTGIVLGLGIAGLLLAGSFGWIPLIDHLIGAVMAFALYFGAAQLANLLMHSQTLRPFDAMLPASLGAWLGWHSLPGFLGLCVIIALKLIGAYRNLDVPYGDRAIAVCLCLGTWVTWVHFSSPFIAPP